MLSELAITCDKDYITVSFSLRDYPNAVVNTAHLDDPTCKPEVNNDTVSFSIGLMGCGTDVSNSEDSKYIDYKNKIHLKIGSMDDMDKSSSITRKYRVVLPFMCSYERKSLVTGRVRYSPKTTLVITSAGTKQTSQMRSYRKHRDTTSSCLQYGFDVYKDIII